MDFALVLKVLTLNCWGLPQPYPIGAKDRVRRMVAITRRLKESDYDIVALEEVWSVSDFEEMQKQLYEVLPHSFYFHSGLLGSGVCIFSKGEILDTIMHRFSLNGYPHHVHRGDWFGGKVVGMVKINIQGFNICAYVTHVHAEYDRDADMYLPHRVVQAFEISQFVKSTSGAADVVFLMGDLNFEASDLGYQLVLANGHLQDAWVDRMSGEETDIDEGNTCDIPSNSYAEEASLARWPSGKRIDYMLYGAFNGVRMAVKECRTDFHRIPPTEDISYSDHAAVVGTFQISGPEQGVKEGLNRPVSEQRDGLLVEASRIIDQGMETVLFNRKFFGGALVILLTLFFYTIDLEISVPRLALVIIGLRFLITLAIGFCLVTGIIMHSMEWKALEAAQTGIKVLLGRRGQSDQ